MVDLLQVWIEWENFVGIRRVSQSQVGIGAYTRVPAYVTVRLYTEDGIPTSETTQNYEVSSPAV